MARKVTAETKTTLLDAYSQVIEEARQEFEAEKAEQLAEWKKELARKKEEDLYQFNKEKREREDALEADLKERVTAVAKREDAVNERELAADHAEATIADLQAKVAEIPTLVSNAESNGALKGRNEAKKDFDNDLRLKEAENHADKRVLENKIESLEATVATQAEIIKTFRAEISAANSRVETIATNAVTAAGQSKVTVNAAQGK